MAVQYKWCSRCAERPRLAPVGLGDRAPSACPERADEADILEGVAEQVTDLALLRRVAAVFSDKYQWPLEPTGEGVRDQHGNAGPVFAVHPRVVFAWNEFPQDATRWHVNDD